MRAKQITAIRMVGICGIISPIAGFMVLLVAISRSPWFNWTENHLSVLGVRGSASTLFNCGLVIVGILSFMFAIGLGKGILPNKWLGQVSTVALALGSGAIGVMGIFPRTTGIPQTLSCLPWSLWSIVFGARLLIRP